MNPADFTYLIDSYIKKYGEFWVIRNVINPEFDYIASGIHRDTYRFENFAIKVANESYDYDEALTANATEAKLFSYFGLNPLLRDHFPECYYISPSDRILIVEFVEGNSGTNRFDRNRNTERLERLIKAAGSSPPSEIRDIHRNNFIIRNRKRVFIDLGHCAI